MESFFDIVNVILSYFCISLLLNCSIHRSVQRALVKRKSLIDFNFQRLLKEHYLNIRNLLLNIFAEHLYKTLRQSVRFHIFAIIFGCVASLLLI